MFVLNIDSEKTHFLHHSINFEGIDGKYDVDQTVLGSTPVEGFIVINRDDFREIVIPSITVNRTNLVVLSANLRSGVGVCEGVGANLSEYMDYWYGWTLSNLTNVRSISRRVSYDTILNVSWLIRCLLSRDVPGTNKYLYTLGSGYTCRKTLIKGQFVPSLGLFNRVSWEEVFMDIFRSYPELNLKDLSIKIVNILKH